MFNELITQPNESLNAGNVDLARTLLDEAWEHAEAEEQEQIAHDLANLIQGVLLAPYL